MLPFLVLLATQQGFFSQVVPHPTGKNGYEEYVRAAEIVNSDACRVAIEFNPKSTMPPEIVADLPPARRAKVIETWRSLQGKSPLQVHRMLLKNFGKVLDLIRLGNTKPTLSTRELNLETIFPEMSSLRLLARFGIQCADALLADGRPTEAMRVNFDLMDMSIAIQRDTLIANLVGLSCEAIVMGGFQTQLDRYSEVDWKTLERRVADWLSAPSPIPQMIDMERKFALLGFDAATTAKSDNLFGAIGQKTRESDLLRRMRQMSPNELANLRDQVEFELQNWDRQIVALLAKPEAKWFDVPELGEVTDAEIFIGFVQPSYTQVLVSNARLRTQMRLLRLHALLQIYRWNWGELPQSLADVADASLVNDPLSEQPFVFDRQGSGYRLLSKGSAQTGEIELVYRSSRTVSKPNDPPR